MKCRIGDAENYVSSGGNFFKLENDGETAKIRFMYNTIDDVEYTVVHEIDAGDGKKRFVNCLRSYDEPVDNCPLCAAGSRAKPLLFMPIYNEDAKETQIWQRGRSFEGVISGLCSRYSPLVSTVIEIERHGKKGDKSTTYQPYPGKSDDVTLDDLPEKPDPVGTIVLDKNFDELSYYVEHGSFNDDTKPVERSADKPVQRNTVTPPRRKF
jgi:hypothetical protein